MVLWSHAKSMFVNIFAVANVVVFRWHIWSPCEDRRGEDQSIAVQMRSVLIFSIDQSPIMSLWSIVMITLKDAIYDDCPDDDGDRGLLCSEGVIVYGSVTSVGQFSRYIHLWSYIDSADWIRDLVVSAEMMEIIIYLISNYVSRDWIKLHNRRGSIYSWSSWNVCPWW